MKSGLRKVYTSSEQIKRGALMSYIGLGFSILSGLIYTPWMVRQIGQADYGLYTLSVSLISFFAMDFGLGSAVSRFLSKYRAVDDKDGERKFLGITFKLFAFITFAIFLTLVIIYFLIENIYVELTPPEIEKLKVIYVISGLFTIISFPFNPFDGILIAYERFAFLKFLDLLHKFSTVLLLVIALFLGYGLYAIVMVNAFVGLIKLVIKYIYIRKNIQTGVELGYRNKSLYGEIFKFSAWTTVILVGQRFILNITPTILGAFAGSIHIAIFSVGMTIEGYTFMIAYALNGLFLPKVTKILEKNINSHIEIEDLLIKVGRIQLLVIGYILSVFVSLGHDFVALWMGNNFINSYYVALLLITPSIIILTQEIANTALIAKNEIKYRAVSTVVVAVISVALSLYLSPKYGAIGSAAAVFTGNIIGLVIFMNLIYQKILGINILRFIKECHFKMILPIGLTALIGFSTQIVIPGKGWIFFISKLIITSLSYAILMWLISFNVFEKKLFIDYYNKINRKHINN